MTALRRFAVRVLSARPSTSALLSSSSPARAAIRSAPAIWRQQDQWSPSIFQKRFASDEARPEAHEALEEATSAEAAPPVEETSATSWARGRDAPPPPNRTIYVGNLFFETTEADITKFFEEFGAIESVKIVYDPRGLSRGFAYVTYDSTEEAGKAVEARNFEMLHGRRLTVQYHRQKPQRASNAARAVEYPPSRTLFIGNMSFEMSDKDLNDLFREVRNVLDVRVAIDRRSGQPRGFAHADFIDVESATKAMEMLQGKEVYGRALRVNFSHSSPTRRPGRGEREASADESRAD